MTPPSVTELAGPLRTPAAGRRLADRVCLVVGATSGIGVRNPNPGLALYGASKAAAIALTRAPPRWNMRLKGSASTQSHRAASLRK